MKNLKEYCLLSNILTDVDLEEIKKIEMKKIRK